MCFGIIAHSGGCSDSIAACDLGDHSYGAFFVVAHSDAFYAEIATNGAQTNEQPEDMEWGMREIDLETPDGHRNMIGQSIVSQD